MKKAYLSVEHRIVDGKKESVMVLDVSDIEKQDESPLDCDSSNKLMDAVEIFHTGVIRMSFDVPGLVRNRTHATVSCYLPYLSHSVIKARYNSRLC